ncbi:MAG: hypothetical protein UR15_C0025G0020 [Parcubacteria group bacterium GW2011_GWA2_31_28]|nr:MAG: hypothetical protein UR15_C0025G0020 [Parcubacteria group bacterium GW2011_GWA2_31_28]
MLRVAALSQILSENWKDVNLDRKSITLTCIFHDMANIIKFDFNRPSLFKEEENQTDYWEKVQQEIIQKYGSNIHQATLKICKEIGLPKKVLKLISNLEWDNALKVLENNDMESALTIYCDMRIGPYGIKSLNERIDDLQSRNKNHDMNFIRKAATVLEEKIQKSVSIDVNSIKDSSLNSQWTSLLVMKI